MQKGRSNWSQRTTGAKPQNHALRIGITEDHPMRETVSALHFMKKEMICAIDKDVLTFIKRYDIFIIKGVPNGRKERKCR